MSQTIQIVHTCNHVVETHEKKCKKIQMERSGEASDEIQGGLSVKKIYHVFAEDPDDNLTQFFYYEDVDFVLTAESILTWRTGRGPASGETYYIECYCVESDIEEFSDDECPRCMGCGWYVSFTNQEENSVVRLSGSGKIVQEFLKILFTYRRENDEYGTRLADYIGYSVTNEAQVIAEITSIVSGAAEEYKSFQTDAMINGLQLPASEILEDMVINSVEFEVTEEKIYLEISLYSQAGAENTIGLSV